MSFGWPRTQSEVAPAPISTILAKTSVRDEVLRSTHQTEECSGSFRASIVGAPEPRGAARKTVAEEAQRPRTSAQPATSRSSRSHTASRRRKRPATMWSNAAGPGTSRAPRGRGPPSRARSKKPRDQRGTVIGETNAPRTNMEPFTPALNSDGIVLPIGNEGIVASDQRVVSPLDPPDLTDLIRTPWSGHVVRPERTQMAKIKHGQGCVRGSTHDDRPPSPPVRPVSMRRLDHVTRGTLGRIPLVAGWRGSTHSARDRRVPRHVSGQPYSGSAGKRAPK